MGGVEEGEGVRGWVAEVGGNDVFVVRELDLDTCHYFFFLEKGNGETKQTVKKRYRLVNRHFTPSPSDLSCKSSLV